MISGILVEKEEVVRDCIVEAFADYKLDLEAHGRLPKLTRETFEGKKLFISTSLQIEAADIFALFHQVKKIDKDIVTVLLSGNNQLIEESISIDAIDLRLPKGIGISKMISNFCRQIQESGSIASDQIDFLETKFGIDTYSKSYWAQNYLVYGRPRSISRKDQRKVASQVLSGETLEEVLSKAHEDAIYFNRKRASTMKLLLKNIVPVKGTRTE